MTGGMGDLEKASRDMDAADAPAGMGDLEKASRDMDAAAPALATAGAEQNALIPADLRVHLMGGGAITRIGAKLNPGLKRSVYYYWFMVVSALSLTNHLFPKNQVLITPMLTVISVFAVFLAAICLMFRAVIKQAA